MLDNTKCRKTSLASHLAKRLAQDFRGENSKGAAARICFCGRTVELLEDRELLELLDDCDHYASMNQKT